MEKTLKMLPNILVDLEFFILGSFPFCLLLLKHKAKMFKAVAIIIILNINVVGAAGVRWAHQTPE